MKRIVIKVGSGVLSENNEIAKERMMNLVSFIARLQPLYEVILVTSGAVSSGYTELKLDRKEHISKKVLASLGQPILMSNYKRKFDTFNLSISQILLTEEDFDSRKRTAIFRDIIDSLLANGVIPIVNENDISTTPEQVFGDNDQLSAHVTYYTDADLLVILSDIDGYYNQNPHENPNAMILKEVHQISDESLNASQSPNHSFATGGIVTKLMAAQFLLERGKKMFLCSGYNLTTIEDYLIHNIHNSGTLFSQ